MVVPESQAARPRWKAGEEPESVLTEESLFFVNRDQAVEDLCRVHHSVFIGATKLSRAGL